VSKIGGNTSYPERTVVPYSISDSVLNNCAKLRSNGRYPVLAWSKPTGPFILRGGVPLLFQKSRDAETQLVDAYLALAKNHKLTIVDTGNISVAVIDIYSNEGEAQVWHKSAFPKCEMLYLSLGEFVVLRTVM
jgi:hypothetical protein